MKKRVDKNKKRTRAALLPLAGVLAFSACAVGAENSVRQITFDARDHVMGVYNAWSPDGQWLVYTCGPNHLNEVVEKVNAHTGETKTLYRIENQTPFGPGCGTASYCNTRDRIVFIHGPRHATAERKYEFWRRCAGRIDESGSNQLAFLDARDITPPFTRGALRGGTHCHQFSSDGNWITFTYNDMLVSPDLRTIGVSSHRKSVAVDEHIENHDGEWFSALLIPVSQNPQPGSGELSRAYENCWVEFPTGRRAVAFKGDHLSADGVLVTDLFLVNVPDLLEEQSPDRPMAGTETHLPFPPKGAVVRKLTDLQQPGMPKLSRLPRTWLSSAPDGTSVFFLARDADGINQVYSVSTDRGVLRRMTSHKSDVVSSVSVHSSGRKIAYICDGSVFVTHLDHLTAERLTGKGRYNPRNVKWSHGEELTFESRAEQGKPIQILVLNP